MILIGLAWGERARRGREPRPGNRALTRPQVLTRPPGGPLTHPPPPQYPPSAAAKILRRANWLAPGIGFSVPCRVGLPTVIETAVSQWGQPNGYVLGEEAGGAFFRRTTFSAKACFIRRNAGDLKVCTGRGQRSDGDIGGEGGPNHDAGLQTCPRPRQSTNDFAGIDGFGLFLWAASE